MTRTSTTSPTRFDFGAWTDELRLLFSTIRDLTPDERARVTYSLGEEPPMLFDTFEDIVDERMWARSRALEDAIEQVWRERVDEGPPLLFPRGRVFGNGIVVVNAYAQWRLLGEAIAQARVPPCGCGRASRSGASRRGRPRSVTIASASIRTLSSVALTTHAA